MMSSIPCTASSAASWPAPSSLQRTEVPRSASSGESLRKVPPSIVPVLAGEGRPRRAPHAQPGAAGGAARVRVEARGAGRHTVVEDPDAGRLDAGGHDLRLALGE